MQRSFAKLAAMMFALFFAVGLAGCGVNDVPKLDEQVKAAWSEVLNQYQRRSDLVPNLVETVKGYAKQEQDTLTQVTEARAKATQMQVPPDILNNPQAFHQFEQNQAELGGALSRLLAVSERYPDLKSNANFLALQSQLEGTENRIAVARRRYNLSLEAYDNNVQSFPNSIWANIAGFKYRDEYFKGNPANATAPTVDFGK